MHDGLLEFGDKKLPPFISRESNLRIDHKQVAGHGGLPHVPKAAPLRIQIEDTQRFFGSVLIGGIQVRPNANGAIAAKAEKLIGIVDARLDHVVDVVWRGPIVFVVAARICLSARPIKVVPGEGQMRKVPLPSKMFDMLTQRVDVALTICATAPLHLL
jgi:hypothetical protein